MLPEKIQNNVAMAERAWERASKKYPDGDRRLIEPLYRLAYVYQTIGRRTESLPMLQRCLAMYNATGMDDLNFLPKLLTHLGGALCLDGRHSEAMPHFQQALEIRMKLLGPDHPDTVWVMNNMGTACRILNQLEKSEELLSRALAVVQKLPAAKKKLLPRLHANLSSTYFDLQRYDLARDHCLKAIELDVKQFGPDSINLAARYNNLGWILMEMGDQAGAEEYLMKSYNIRLNLFGLNHPDLVHNLTNLGEFQLRKGDPDQAEKYLFQAVSVAERTHSPEDPENGKVQLLLGNCFAARGLEDTAEGHYQQAIDIIGKARGPEHPDLAAANTQMAVLRQQTNQWEASLEPLEKALAIYERAAGPDDRRTGQTLELLAKAYQALGRKKEAEECRGRAEAIKEKNRTQ